MSWSWSSLAWMAWGAPLLPFFHTVLNLLTWKRPSARAGSTKRLPGAPARGGLRAPGAPSVSVLIPARNEGARIGAALDALAQQTLKNFEVVVCDDQSTDDTARVLEDYASRYDWLRWVRGAALPAGWIGKPHACHQLSHEARGDVLFFLDADVRLEPVAIERLSSFFEEERADVLSLVPRQDMSSFFERLVLPLLVLTYVSWFPLRLVSWGRDPRLVAANGQLLLVRRSAYVEGGGFEAVRGEIVDDVAFCRRAKAAGQRVVFADGTEVARCRMYGSASQVWAGFSKNLFEGLGSPLALLAAMSLYFVCLVAPYFTLVGGWVSGDAALLEASLWGVGLLTAQRALLAARFHHPLEGIVLHPFSVLALLGIAVNSLLWHRGDRVRWADRVYAGRARRPVAAPEVHGSTAEARVS